MATLFFSYSHVDERGGWVTAIDADTGKVVGSIVRQRLFTAALVATAGGLVFSADMSGNVVALDASSGKKLWIHNLGQPVGGGLVSYVSGGHQRVAVAAGLSSPLWPIHGDSGRIVIFGLP